MLRGVFLSDAVNRIGVQPVKTRFKSYTRTLPQVIPEDPEPVPRSLGVRSPSKTGKYNLYLFVLPLSPLLHAGLKLLNGTPRFAWLPSVATPVSSEPHTYNNYRDTCRGNYSDDHGSDECVG